MDLALNGKTALVTGGSRGLGRQSALSLAAEGVNVAICGRTRQTLDIAVSEIEKNGVNALGIEADVSDVKSMHYLHSEVESQLGPIDILVNNAGGSRARTNIAETDLEDFKGTFDLNLFGGFELMKLVIPSMKEQRWGRIINIASIWGREYGGNISYMSAKAALIARCYIFGEGWDTGQFDSAGLHRAPRGYVGTFSERQSQGDGPIIYRSESASWQIWLAGALGRSGRFSIF